MQNHEETIGNTEIVAVKCYICASYTMETDPQFSKNPGASYTMARHIRWKMTVLALPIRSHTEYNNNILLSVFTF